MSGKKNEKDNRIKKKKHCYRYDWEAIRSEYVTGSMSIKELSQKHGIRYRSLAEKCSKGGWVAARKKHKTQVTDRAIAKVATMQANALANELYSVDRISEILRKTLDDAEQFNRHLVETKAKQGGTEIQTIEEQVFNKVDTRSLKEAAQTLKMVEEIKRSLLSIQTMEDKNRELRERRKLEMEEAKLQMDREKLEMQKQQAEQNKPDKDITVTIKGFEEGWAD